MSHLHGPAATKIRVLENENKMLKSEIERIHGKSEMMKLKLGPIQNEHKMESSVKPSMNPENEKLEYTAFPNRSLENIYPADIFNIELFGETIITCFKPLKHIEDLHDYNNEIKLYLKYHDVNTNTSINDLSIFSRIILTYGKQTIAVRHCNLEMVTKGSKDFYSLSDIFPGLEFCIKNTTERHLKLQFDVDTKWRFKIDEMYCDYPENKTTKPINTINCFKDFFTYGTSYENDDYVYYSRVRIIDMRNHKPLKKSNIDYDLYINDKYINCGKDDRSKGLHYYKFDKDVEKYYCLYVQQVYQFKTD